MALTLRLLCGLSTAEVARAFLVERADHGGPHHPGQEEDRRGPHPLPGAARGRAARARIDAVLDVVHLLFTTGHTAPAGADLVRRDLVERAARPGPHAADRCCPTTPTSPACSRSSCSPTPAAPPGSAPDGRLVLLADQDRTRWDRRRHRRGLALVREALLRRPPRPVRADGRDRRRARRGAELGGHRLGRGGRRSTTCWCDLAVAGRRPQPGGRRRPRRGPAAGLAALDALAAEPQLAGYSYLASARADFLRRLGRTDEARPAYTGALLLTENTVERDFLAGRLRALAVANADVGSPV